jgi:hypothetical protein
MFRHRPVRGVLSLAIAVASALVVASCGDTTPGAAYDLTGIVSTALTPDSARTPLGGATVRFTSDTGRVHEAISGEDGRYEMQVFTDTAFGQVRAESTGYEPAERSVYFDVPQRRIDLVLRATPED